MVTVHSPRARDRRPTRSVPWSAPVDNDQRHIQSTDTERMFGRALWLKRNLPISPDEWALLNLLIFADMPEDRPTRDEFERAQVHFASPRELTAVPMHDPAPAQQGKLSDVGRVRPSFPQRLRRGAGRAARHGGEPATPG
jgi:hypothetical protein